MKPGGVLRRSYKLAPDIKTKPLVLVAVSDHMPRPRKIDPKKVQVEQDDVH